MASREGPVGDLLVSMGYTFLGCRNFAYCLYYNPKGVSGRIPVPLDWPSRIVPANLDSARRPRTPSEADFGIADSVVGETLELDRRVSPYHSWSISYSRHNLIKIVEFVRDAIERCRPRLVAGLRLHLQGYWRDLWLWRSIPVNVLEWSIKNYLSADKRSEDLVGLLCRLTLQA